MSEATVQANGRQKKQKAPRVRMPSALNSPALGLAAGCVTHLLVSAFDRDRVLTLGNILAAVVSIGLIALTILY